MTPSIVMVFGLTGSFSCGCRFFGCLLGLGIFLTLLGVDNTAVN
jgi:hypothetical protein